MVTIHINSDVGYSFDSIPDRVYDMVKEVDTGSDGSLQLKIAPEDERQAIGILSSGRRSVETPVRISRVRNIIRISLLREDDRENTADEGPVLNNNAPRGAITEERREAVPVAGVAVAADDHLNGVDLENDSIESQDLEDFDEEERCDTEVTGPIAPPDAPANMAIRLESGMVKPANSRGDIRIERESVYVAIARLLEDDSTNRAKQLVDASNTFNRLFRELLIMKRNIKLMEHDVQSHPVIKDIIQQVEKIKEHTKIDDAYFTDKQIVIVTKTLITDEEIEGAKRLIGKMRLGISLNSFFAPKALTDVDSVITINNLTHRYNSGQRIWECGHVDSSGVKCIGNTYDFLFEAFVNRDLEYIVESLIRFITSPNEKDSWGSHMANWEIAEDGDS